MQFRLTLTAFAWVMALTPFVANAASFNCKRAATEVEKLICSDAELSDLDDELAEEYKRALARSGNPGNLIRAQRRWLAERNACGNRACLIAEYSSRLLVVQATPAAEQINCDPSAGPVDIENCPPSVARATPDQLRTGYCMHGPVGEYIKKSRCTPEETDYVVSRTRIVGGNQTFCGALLTAEYTLIDLNLSHSVSEEDAANYLSLRGATTEVYPMAGRFDVNNDGTPENIGWIKAYSGAGSGCDVERFVQLDSKRARIANTKLTALLGATTCSDYYRAFRYKGKTYLENRRIKRLPSYAYVDLIREVIALEGDARRVVCRYAYKDD